jgi:hypothetical protein
MPRSALPACRRPWGGPLGVSRGRCGSITPARAAVQPGSGWVTGAGRRNPRHGLRTRCLPSGRPPAYITGTARARRAARGTRHEIVLPVTAAIVPARRRSGGVAERLKAHAWKACIRETVSRVRIPLPPPAGRLHERIRRHPGIIPPAGGDDVAAGWRRRRRDNRTLRARKTLSPGSGNFLRSALALPIRPEARPWARPGPI